MEKTACPGNQGIEWFSILPLKVYKAHFRGEEKELGCLHVMTKFLCNVHTAFYAGFGVF